jgi:hypothetical protein
MSRIPEARTSAEVASGASEPIARAAVEDSHAQLTESLPLEGGDPEEASYLDAAAGGEFLDDRLRLRE